jgi:hypothetical protein
MPILVLVLVPRTFSPLWIQILRLPMSIPSDIRHIRMSKTSTFILRIEKEIVLMVSTYQSPTHSKHVKIGHGHRENECVSLDIYIYVMRLFDLEAVML